MIVGPPAAPTVKIGLPSLSTIVGLMLESGRLPGSTALASAPIRPNALGTPGWAEKSSISLFITTPVPGVTTPEPKVVLTVAVQATHQPSVSAAEKWVVCLPNKSVTASGGVEWASILTTFTGSILLASRRAYFLEAKPLGTGAKSASPSQ